MATTAAESAGLARARLIGDDAMALFQSAGWPGNVRQLKNVLEWLLIMAPGDPKSEIGVAEPAAGVRRQSATAGHASASPMASSWSLPIREAREHFERAYLQSQLRALRRQHLAHRDLRGHGALGPAPQAQVAQSPQ
jgi:two-component system, NtrC family, nitrogen regulation response regulator NtrX